MSYLVLARKWRPRDFGQVAGQQHVLRALVNALDSGRLHHAFLFSGTRGVGKTTLARIFAKSINCERGVSSKPCGECSACREVDEGRFVDLIEVDAASRTRVDDTRELLDNVQYAPTRGRYKVYLIDEVHMLSTHSFNALLKTLEEPPPHVKFLLATTDPQKLPVTVLSRCLQFNLKRLPPTVIAEQLVRIAEAEEYEYEPSALHLLAVAADGSMRDALSLLDQAVAHAGGRLAREDVAAMLGTVERTHVVRMLEALGEDDGRTLLGIVKELVERGLDPDAVLSEVAALLQQVALAQVVPDALAERVDETEAIASLAERVDPESVQLWYQMAIAGRGDLHLAPTPQMGLEMTLLRMLAFHEGGHGGGSGAAGGPGPAEARPPAASASSGAGAATSPASASPGAGGAASRASPPPRPAAAAAPVPEAPERPNGPARAAPAAVAPGETAPPPLREALRETLPAAREAATHGAPPKLSHESHRGTPREAPPEVRGSPEAPAAPGAAPAQPASTGAAFDWDGFLASLGAGGMLRQLADNCLFEAVEGGVVKLIVDRDRAHLLTPAQRSAMETALGAFCGGGFKLAFSVGDTGGATAAARAAREQQARRRRAVQSLKDDPRVQALQALLGAELIEESVQPREEPPARGAGAGGRATGEGQAPVREDAAGASPGRAAPGDGAAHHSSAPAAPSAMVAAGDDGRMGADRAGLA